MKRILTLGLIGLLGLTGCRTTTEHKSYNIKPFTLTIESPEYIRELGKTLGHGENVRALWIEPSRTMYLNSLDSPDFNHEIKHLKEVYGRNYE